MASPFLPNFFERPRMQAQTLRYISASLPDEIAGFLRAGHWNDLPVALFRNGRQDAQPGAARGQQPASVCSFDLTTLVIPKGFAPTPYQLQFQGDKAAVQRLPVGRPLENQFSALLALNLDEEGQSREWLHPKAIHPCKLFPAQAGGHGRGDERCALLITNSAGDGEEEQFQLFEYTGQITVNQWVKPAPGQRARKQEINLLEEPADEKKSYFMPLLLPDNSLCYYLIPGSRLESELAAWHEEIKKAKADGKTVMVAINGPIYHRDDWGICFSEIVELVVDSAE